MLQTSVYMTKRLRAQTKLAATISGVPFTEFMAALAEREIERLARQDKFAVLATINEEGVAETEKGEASS